MVAANHAVPEGQWGKAEAGGPGYHGPMALSPSLPAWYLHVAAGTWEPLWPMEPVLKAHNGVAAGNPVTSSHFGPGEASVCPEQALPGRTEWLSPPWML